MRVWQKMRVLCCRIWGFLQIGGLTPPNPKSKSFLELEDSGSHRDANISRKRGERPRS